MSVIASTSLDPFSLCTSLSELDAIFQESASQLTVEQVASAFFSGCRLLEQTKAVQQERKIIEQLIGKIKIAKFLEPMSGPIIFQVAKELAKLQHEDAQTFTFLIRNLARKRSELSEEEVVGLLQICVQVNCRDAWALDRLKEVLCAVTGARYFEILTLFLQLGQTIKPVLQNLSRLTYSDKAYFQRFVTVCCDQIDHFCFEELACIVKECAKFQIRYEPFLCAVAKRVDYRSSHVVPLMCGYALLEYQNDDLLERVCTEWQGSDQDTLNLFWACTKLGNDRLLEQALAILSRYDAKDCEAVLYAFCMLGFDHEPFFSVLYAKIGGYAQIVAEIAACIKKLYPDFQFSLEHSSIANSAEKIAFLIAETEPCNEQLLISQGWRVARMTSDEWLSLSERDREWQIISLIDSGC